MPPQPKPERMLSVRERIQQLRTDPESLRRIGGRYERLLRRYRDLRALYRALQRAHLQACSDAETYLTALKTLQSARRDETEQFSYDDRTMLLNVRGLKSKLKEKLFPPTRGLKVLADSFPNLVVTVILLDIDNFKQLNDRYADHNAGDYVIRTHARVLRETFNRELDFVGRRNSDRGDEVLIVIVDRLAPHSGVRVSDWPSEDDRRHVDTVEATRRRAEMARLAIANARYPDYPEIGEVTASFGIASKIGFPGTFDEIWAAILELVARADEAMYESKRKGRNEVTIHVSLQHKIEATRGSPPSADRVKLPLSTVSKRPHTR